MSPSTVKTYLKSIYHKLHIRNRAELVIHAYETGIIKPRNSHPFEGLASESEGRKLTSVG